MKKILSVIVFTGFIFTVCEARTLRAEENVSDSHIIKQILNELRSGSFTGEIGLYYEQINYEKDSFVEDNEISDLNDSHVVVPFFQVDYVTPEYFGFDIGAGITGYAHLDGSLDRSNEMKDNEHFVFHQLYLKYSISKSTLQLGRHELEDTVFLSEYYEAVSFTSGEIKNTSFLFALVGEVAESDISKFIEFQNINRGDDSIDDYLYVVETTWDPVPDVMKLTLYYYHQGKLYDLYGTHLEVLYETEDIDFGIHADVYATDEDNRNGMRDADDRVKNSDVYHIHPFIEMKNITFGSGYIGTDSDVGAREGGLIDDYFNPFNEGDKVYKPDAETWYGALSYDSDNFNIELVFGRTDYPDGAQFLSEEELDMKAGLTFLDNFRMSAEFGIVDSDSPEGDFNLFEIAFTYEF